MMEFIPEKIDNGVVFTARRACPQDEDNCALCSDFAVGVHNWLLAHEVQYVIVDLCDEKDVCPELLVELLQLRKRLKKYPFFFAGVMDRPKKVLQSHSYLPGSPLFTTPEDAVAEVRKKFPNLMQKSLDGIQFGQPLNISRPRTGVRGEGVEGPEAAEGAEEGAELDEH